jgi:hypothetical protein
MNVLLYEYIQVLSCPLVLILVVAFVAKGKSRSQTTVGPCRGPRFRGISVNGDGGPVPIMTYTLVVVFFEYRLPNGIRIFDGSSGPPRWRIWWH